VLKVAEELEYGACRYNSCGHYLTVLSSDETLAGILHPSDENEEHEKLPGSDEQSHELTVYLRPDFVTDGLDIVHDSCSEEVMILKDVIIQIFKGMMPVYLH